MEWGIRLLHLGLSSTNAATKPQFQARREPSRTTLAPLGSFPRQANSSDRLLHLLRSGIGTERQSRAAVGEGAVAKLLFCPG
jgi:hypothetical protein